MAQHEGRTPMQDRYYEEYQKDRNATQAAIRAGFSPKSAKVIGSRLVTRARAENRVDAGELATETPDTTTPEQILRDLKAIAIKAKLKGAYSAAIKAKELIGRHIGMWPARMELTGANGGPVQFAQAPFDASRLAPEDRQALRKLLERAAGKDDAPSQAQQVDATIEHVGKATDGAK